MPSECRAINSKFSCFQWGRDSVFVQNVSVFGQLSQREILQRNTEVRLPLRILIVNYVLKKSGRFKIYISTASFHTQSRNFASAQSHFLIVIRDRITKCARKPTSWRVDF